MRIFFLLSIGVLLPVAAAAQQTVLERYVQTGVQENLALQQQNLSLAQSLRSLDEARGLFMPSIDIVARYSRAGGGRQIEFPVGDLLNPAYMTLNELLAAQGEPPRFPENLANVSIPFLREREQESKIRLTQPLFQPDIYYNYRIQRELSDARRAERDAFTRQLIAEVKTSYYRYLIADRLASLLQRTRELLAENLRVSTSLFQADKVTQDVVFRARAELSSLEQNLLDADAGRKNAARYFNFLLNRPLDAAIEALHDDSLRADHAFDVAELQARALAHRDEFRQLAHAIAASGDAARLARANALPSVAFVLDYGIQGENYRVGRDDDFWMATIALRWNLFNGFQDRARHARATLQQRELQTQQRELEQQIALQVNEAHDRLLVARSSIGATQDRVQSATRSFRIVNRKFEEGVAAQVEFLDARTTMTEAEVDAIIARYEYQIRLAQLERIAALYDINSLNVE